MRMCLTLETQRILEHTLSISPDTDKTVDEVLDELQEHIKNSRNEALRRRDLLNCKQRQGESFSDFYVRIRHISEEIDVCPGKTCEETQLKMVILMGVCDEELVQKLLSLDTTPSLQDIVNTCRAYEATRSATSAIRAPSSQINAVSTYKRNKQRDQSSAIQQSSASVAACWNCGHEHEKGKCSAADKFCSNCGRQGHFTKSPACPATNVQCHNCKRVGHYDRCCRSRKPAPQDRNTTSYSRTYHQKTKNCRRVGSPQKTPTLTTVNLTYGGTTTQLDMLPDTGADITVIGRRHLKMLRISSSSLRSPPPTTTFTADGSSMAPALGTCQALLSIGSRSYTATIYVHEDVQTPLLSYGHCQELAIISREFPKPIVQVKHVNKSVWCAGKLLRIPDALSRAPVSRPTPEDEMACAAATAHLRAIVTINAVTPNDNSPPQDTDRTLQELRDASRVDPVYIRLRDCVTSGFPKWQAKAEDCDRRAAARAELVQEQYNQHARPLPRLRVGDTVRIQNPTSLRWDKVGVVMSCGRSRDYEVRLPSGRVYWRNRRFLRPINPPGVDPLPHIPEPPVSCTDPVTESVIAPTTPRRSERLQRTESAR
ncbi:hypothetical protein Pmani_024480 [Petrolisthes manimaculis]|uniref:CCHC-type domain-containing protein n=1 Tax=Petrolisthes manimaculis TaxID=1843537 RepID=A0AAE1P952_9EUCA|nr:hypothetical protein Pmani_024480 [Petrolisthes manimaculis]